MGPAGIFPNPSSVVEPFSPEEVFVKCKMIKDHLDNDNTEALAELTWRRSLRNSLLRTGRQKEALAVQVHGHLGM